MSLFWDRAYLLSLITSEPLLKIIDMKTTIHRTTTITAILIHITEIVIANIQMTKKYERRTGT